jgi:hypothetical protein
LVDIGKGQFKDFTGRKILSKTGFLGSTVIKSLSQLEKKDYIYKAGNEYCIIDPLIKASLRYFLDDEM